MMAISLCKSTSGIAFPASWYYAGPRGKSRAARQCRRCGNRRAAMQLKRARPSLSSPPRRIRSPFRSPPPRASSTVRRAGRRLFPLSTEQQPAIRRATPFCSLALSGLRERATETAASLLENRARRIFESARPPNLEPTKSETTSEAPPFEASRQKRQSVRLWR